VHGQVFGRVEVRRHHRGMRAEWPLLLHGVHGGSAVAVSALARRLSAAQVQEHRGGETDCCTADGDAGDGT
jgi:hypothetical protein